MGPEPPTGRGEEGELLTIVPYVRAQESIRCSFNKTTLAVYFFSRVVVFFHFRLPLVFFYFLAFSVALRRNIKKSHSNRKPSCRNMW